MININESHKPISFWDFLGQYNCVIPIIQRDYAQGRKGKEELRKKFFGQIISALTNNNPLMMDFVYGCPSENNANVVFPLDGQQRLTTLWLLHWYLAYKAGDSFVNGDFWTRMKKFTYQTRTSSREFCEKLCQKIKPVSFNDELSTDVKHVIQSQPWFSRRFKKDPTVQAMLRSLSDAETESGFEQLLKSCDFKAMLQSLMTDTCPIKFYFRSTAGEGISNPDDLYVKMNARGKKLTQFENFKAELFSFQDSVGVEIFRRNDGLEFVKRHENQWTNLFWTIRHNKNNIVDHIQFEFFNRMALAYLVAFGDVDEKDKNLYDYITKHSQFTSIDVYKAVLGKRFKRLFTGVMNGIISINPKGIEINKCFIKPYEFNYLPVYEEDPRKDIYTIEENNYQYLISGLSVRVIVSFYAASMFYYYFNLNAKRDKEPKFNNRYFNDWMIFCRNLFENSGIDTYGRAKNILLLFNRINRHCLSIIKFLSSPESVAISIDSERLKVQFEEEIEKAKKIDESRLNKDGNNIEELIRSAENWAPLYGAIRSLITNADGDYDWSCFITKRANLEIILKLSNDNCDDNTSSKKITPLALRTLVSHIENWDDLSLFNYDSSLDSWYEILVRKNELSKAIHKLLLEPINEVKLKGFESKFEDLIQRDIQEDLVKSKFLHQTTLAGFYFRQQWHGFTVWRSSAQKKRYLLGTPRNRLLSYGVKTKQIDISVVENSLLGDNEHFWGENIYFSLCENTSKYVFWWYRNIIWKGNSKDIYLCYKDGLKYVNPQNPEMFALDIDYGCSYDEFEKQLKELISKAENSESQ